MEKSVFDEEEVSKRITPLICHEETKQWRARCED